MNMNKDYLIELYTFANQQNIKLVEQKNSLHIISNLFLDKDNNNILTLNIKVIKNGLIEKSNFNFTIDSTTYTFACCANAIENLLY